MVSAFPSARRHAVQLIYTRCNQLACCWRVCVARRRPRFLIPPSEKWLAGLGHVLAPVGHDIRPGCQEPSRESVARVSTRFRMEKVLLTCGREWRATAGWTGSPGTHPAIGPPQTCRRTLHFEHVALSPDGKHIAAATSWKTRCYQLTVLAFSSTSAGTLGPSREPTPFEFSPDGRWVIREFAPRHQRLSPRRGKRVVQILGMACFKTMGRSFWRRALTRTAFGSCHRKMDPARSAFAGNTIAFSPDDRCYVTRTPHGQ